MRAIDVDRVKREIRKNKEKIVISCKQKYVPLSLIYEILNKAPTLTPPNEPLTLDELRQMGGEPVWVQTPGIPKYGRWVIVAGVDTEDGQRTLYCQGDYTCRNYGRDWIAYRRPPEGEA